MPAKVSDGDFQRQCKKGVNKKYIVSFSPMWPRHPADCYQDCCLSNILIIAQKEARGTL